MYQNKIYRLLIADDEMIERAVLYKTLKSRFGENCEIYQAENGREAVRIHEEIVHIRAKHKIFRFLPPATAETEAPEGISRGQRYEICLFSCPK